MESKAIRLSTPFILHLVCLFCFLSSCTQVEVVRDNTLLQKTGFQNNRVYRLQTDVFLNKDRYLSAIFPDHAQMPTIDQYLSSPKNYPDIVGILHTGTLLQFWRLEQVNTFEDLNYEPICTIQTGFMQGKKVEVGSLGIYEHGSMPGNFRRNDQVLTPMDNPQLPEPF